MEDFRLRKGQQSEQILQDDLKKLLFVDTTGAKLGEIQQLRAITLSITTRAIGFGISQTVFTAISIKIQI